jgi:putative ATPase
MDLLSYQREKLMKTEAPLALRMRPERLDEFVGQKHIVGKNTLLYRAVMADKLRSAILYGPPGTGKTTLAQIIACTTKSDFVRLNATTSGTKDIRAVVDSAKSLMGMTGQRTILFIDEIHRFNKAQQDVLLPYVEDGTVTLIGATTHNPNIFVNSPLTSRSLVFELRPLTEGAVATLVSRALTDTSRGLGNLKSEIAPEAISFLSTICDGDARRALTALEVAVRSTPPSEDGVIRVTRDVMEDSVQRKMILYDKDEDGHYDTISAFIKSVRGSDPDAAIYWLAKMIEAGEDPRFIARRLIILASEDIGNADPRGLTVAVAAMQAVEFIGMPEGRITLAQATIYLATAPKSNASYLAVDEALADVRSGRVLAVPEHLKNIHVKAIGKEGLDVAYKYPHDFDQHTVKQDYLPVDKRYYRPTSQGYEDTITKRMDQVAKQKKGKQ